jgi:hypothetical protein
MRVNSRPFGGAVRGREPTHHPPLWNVRSLLLCLEKQPTERGATVASARTKIREDGSISGADLARHLELDYPLLQWWGRAKVVVPSGPGSGSAGARGRRFTAKEAAAVEFVAKGRALGIELPHMAKAAKWLTSQDLAPGWAGWIAMGPSGEVFGPIDKVLGQVPDMTAVGQLFAQHASTGIQFVPLQMPLGPVPRRALGAYEGALDEGGGSG